MVVRGIANRKVENLSDDLALVVVRNAEVHQLMNDNQLAYSYYRVSLDNCLSTHDLKGLYLTYRELGDYYEHIHSPDSALFYYRKSFLMVGETKAASYYIQPGQWLYAYFKQKGRAD